MPRWRITVGGVVQGVGFRPFVYRLAADCALGGWVANGPGGVEMEVEGEREALSAFLHRLRSEPPPRSALEQVAVEEIPVRGERDFSVRPSLPGGGARVPVDLPPCPRCLEEMADPSDRRYRYPFTTCCDCGPRFSLLHALPYDRARTAMAAFPLCPDCQREYTDPASRRFHAEPIACPRCGPRLRVLLPDGASADGTEALAAAVSCLASGGVIGIKGIGGFHLAAVATHPAAVDRLRLLKNRPAKPLAVMVRDGTMAEELAEVRGAEDLLLHPARPVVLLPLRPGGLPEGVAPGLGEVGLFLPYSPLHHLLLEMLAQPVVLTSLNRTGEPLAYRDADAEAWRPRLDGLLTHDRAIVHPLEDSVLAPRPGHLPLLLRRGRGMVPERISLPREAPPLLAMGGDLKAAFAVTRGREILLSSPLGDLAEEGVPERFRAELDSFLHLWEIRPQAILCDPHPAYHSHRLARSLAQEWQVPVRTIQHHHAHLAAVALEHDHSGPLLGLALDGTGYGADGTLWGGELLLLHGGTARRLGRLRPLPLPGGERAVREPWRMLLAVLSERDPALLLHSHPAWDAIPPADRQVLGRSCQSPRLAPRSSSAGRLFDAAAALILGFPVRTYEGEAAMRLEATAAGLGDLLPYGLVQRDGLWELDLRPALWSLWDQPRPAALAAASFHRTLAQGLVALVERVRGETGTSSVLLGGGVWQNRRLLRLVEEGIAAQGGRAFTGQSVPVHDGGLAVGQVAADLAREGT